MIGLVPMDTVAGLMSRLLFAVGLVFKGRLTEALIIILL
jgi:hypothetical protein